MIRSSLSTDYEAAHPAAAAAAAAAVRGTLPPCQVVAEPRLSLNHLRESLMEKRKTESVQCVFYTTGEERTGQVWKDGTGRVGTGPHISDLCIPLDETKGTLSHLSSRPLPLFLFAFTPLVLIHDPCGSKPGVILHF